MVKPVVPFAPRNPRVAPFTGDSFQLDTCEQQLFDQFAQEHVRTAGTLVDFYSRSLEKSKRDPLYDEAIKTAWDGPWRMRIWVEMPQSTPEVREEGYVSTFPSNCWFPRKELEDAHAPIPQEGDIIRIWKGPFFDDFGVDSAPVPGKGYYFTITDVDEDGHLFDNAAFVGFRCTLARNTKFTPERRLQNK